MASAANIPDPKKQEDDELEILFKDFDKKLKEVQQKLSDIEKDITGTRKETPEDENG